MKIRNIMLVVFCILITNTYPIWSTNHVVDYGTLDSSDWDWDIGGWQNDAQAQYRIEHDPEVSADYFYNIHELGSSRMGESELKSGSYDLNFGANDIILNVNGETHTIIPTNYPDGSVFTPTDDGFKVTLPEGTKEAVVSSFDDGVIIDTGGESILVSSDMIITGNVVIKDGVPYEIKGNSEIMIKGIKYKPEKDTVINYQDRAFDPKDKELVEKLDKDSINIFTDGNVVVRAGKLGEEYGVEVSGLNKLQVKLKHDAIMRIGPSQLVNQIHKNYKDGKLKSARIGNLEISKSKSNIKGFNENEMQVQDIVNYIYKGGYNKKKFDEVNKEFGGSLDLSKLTKSQDQGGYGRATPIEDLMKTLPGTGSRKLDYFQGTIERKDNEVYKAKKTYAPGNSQPSPLPSQDNSKIEARTTSTKEYTVKPGDSLWKIANGDLELIESIKERNNLRSDTIYPGQKLIIPGEKITQIDNKLDGTQDIGVKDSPKNSPKRATISEPADNDPIREWAPKDGSYKLKYIKNSDRRFTWYEKTLLNGAKFEVSLEYDGQGKITGGTVKTDVWEGQHKEYSYKIKEGIAVIEGMGKLEKNDPIIQKYVDKYGFETNIVTNLIDSESKGEIGAVNLFMKGGRGTGSLCTGVTQTNPKYDWKKELEKQGVPVDHFNPFDKEQAFAAGMAHLDYSYRRADKIRVPKKLNDQLQDYPSKYHKDIIALAIYNQGNNIYSLSYGVDILKKAGLIKN